MTIENLKNNEPAIYDRVMECRREQQNYKIPNKHMGLIVSLSNGNFNWCDTREGSRFWNDIDRGDFYIFYMRYPKRKSIDNYSII